MNQPENIIEMINYIEVVFNHLKSEMYHPKILYLNHSTFEALAAHKELKHGTNSWVLGLKYIPDQKLALYQFKITACYIEYFSSGRLILDFGLFNKFIEIEKEPRII